MEHLADSGAVQPPRTCVIVSYWVARSPRPLFRLLRQTQSINAGVPFDLVVVCNGGDIKPLTLPSDLSKLPIRVLARVNTGWNLGAWDHGWRATPDYDFYLFLQDDCILKQPNWVSEFEFRAQNDSKVGLIGETIMWDRMSWEYIRIATDRDLGRLAWPESEPVHPLETYQELLKKRGVPPGDVGTHIPTLIVFAPRAVLETVGGFPLIGSTYREAVACEIGISRVVEAHGFRVVAIKSDFFHYIGHPQWGRRSSWIQDLKSRLRAVAVGMGAKHVKRLIRGRR